MEQLLSPSHEILRRIVDNGPDESEDIVLLDDISWEVYEKFLEDIEDVRHLRVTYDEGRMEIMVLTNRHEQNKKLIARLVETYAFVRDLEVTGAGSVTLKKPRRKGLEAYESYYVQAPPPGPEVMLLDLKKYPPPDLGIEIDVSRSSIPRQPIYGALQVQEVWRVTDDRVAFLVRQSDGKYEAAARSLAFPELSSDDMNRFLAMAVTVSQSAVIRAFRDWLGESK